MIKNMKYSKDVIWSLPLLFGGESAYKTLFNLFKNVGLDFPKVNLYGSPYSLWCGNRNIKYTERFNYKTIFKFSDYINNASTESIFEFSKINIDSETLLDGYANFLLDAAFDIDAKFIVCSDKLKNHIKRRKPDALVISSVKKPVLYFQGQNKIDEPTIEKETEYYNKLLKEYDIVTVRPEYSTAVSDNINSLIDDVSRIQIVANQNCITNCPKAVEHYNFMENFHLDGRTRQYTCIKSGYTTKELYDNVCINSDEIIQKLVNNGVKHIGFISISNIPEYILIKFIADNMFHLDGKNKILVSEGINREFEKENNHFIETTMYQKGDYLQT